MSLLAASQDLAFELMNSLDSGQRARAIISPEPPWDLLTWNASRAVFMPNEGLPASQMTLSQKELVTALITEYVGRVRTDVSQPNLDRLKEQGIDHLHLTWAGDVDRAKCH